MLLRKHKAEFANVHMPSLLLSNDYIAGEKRARLSSYLVYCLSRLVAAREHRYRTRRCQPSRREGMQRRRSLESVSYTHLRAHETRHDLVCRLLLEKKKK